ncbi:MAG: hypothetical protein GXO48_08650 [Chlorobi bacterium]|nr:hypothetical protein [Chlorobiota bacterium]
MRAVALLLVFLLSCKTKHYVSTGKADKPVASSLHNNLASGSASASFGYGGFPTRNNYPTTASAKASLQHESSRYIPNMRTTESNSLIAETQKFTSPVDTPPTQNAHQDTLYKAQNETSQQTEIFSDYRCGMIQLIFVIGLIMLLLGSLFAYLFWISNALALKIIFGFIGGTLLLFGLLIVIIHLLSFLISQTS